MHVLRLLPLQPFCLHVVRKERTSSILPALNITGVQVLTFWWRMDLLLTKKATMGENWRVAKVLLKEQLRNGSLGAGSKDPPPKEVWNSKAEYTAVPYNNFQTNLNELRKKVRVQQANESRDRLALVNDRKLHPCIDQSFPYPRWDATTAKHFLGLDIDAKMNEVMKPSQLRQTRDVYKLFPLDVFRNHINQEVKARRESSYWLDKKEKAKKEKEKKKKAREEMRAELLARKGGGGKGGPSA